MEKIKHVHSRSQPTRVVSHSVDQAVGVIGEASAPQDREGTKPGHHARAETNCAQPGDVISFEMLQEHVCNQVHAGPVLFSEIANDADTMEIHDSIRRRRTVSVSTVSSNSNRTSCRMTSRVKKRRCQHPRSDVRHLSGYHEVQQSRSEQPANSRHPNHRATLDRNGPHPGIQSPRDDPPRALIPCSSNAGRAYPSNRAVMDL